MTVFTDNRQSTYLHLHKITSRGTSLFSTDAAGRKSSIPSCNHWKKCRTLFSALSHIYSETFAEILSDFQLLTIFVKSAIIDFWQGPKYRGSHRRWSVRRGVPGNFVKFAAKHLCQSLFYNKVAGLRSTALLKKRQWYRCFPVDFAKLLRTPFFTGDLWWLLPYLGQF